MTERRSWRNLIGAAAVAAACAHSLAGYEVPNAAYAPPTNYYNGATSTVGATLKGQLATIISTGVNNRDYSTADEAMKLLDVDPSNSSRVILIYNRASASNVWDPNNNVTGWNKEHQWPDSKLSSAANGDLFNLRPCNPLINSNRGSQPFGTAAATGSYSDLGTYWFPGDADKGDVARSLFYVATRWSGHTLVNGAAGGTQEMGDLASLLKFHYTDGIDNFERRRNQYIYGSSGDLTNHALNPSYWQGNRNPYIDHPEYVWAVFGGGNNNSQIYVGGAAAADGSSTTTLDLGRVIKGAAIPTGSVAVNKVGANPTTFDVTASGVTTTGASAIPVGVGQPMDYDVVNKTMVLQLSASSATVGVKSGTVTINNTDLTSSGAGRGAQDGNDTINVTATVVDHSNGSFAVGVDQNAKSVGFDYVPQGFTGRTQTFSIANLHAASGYTAGLALNSVTAAGSSAMTTNAAPFAQLAAGSANTYTVALNTAVAGNFTTTTTFNVSDEVIPGATANTPLVLTTTARVIANGDFAVSGTLDLRLGETFSTGPSSIGAGVTLVKDGLGTLNVDGPQTNGGNSTLRVTGGTVLLSTDAGPNLAVQAFNGGTVQLRSDQHLASLMIDNGLVDLLDHSLTLATADPASLRDVLSLGNVFSSTPDPDSVLSIGYIPSGAAGYLLQLTYAGDANLDGRLDNDDYALLDRGLSRSLTGWVNGDFDYSGTIDFADYLLLDTSFGKQAGVLSAGLLADRSARFGGAYVGELMAAVPEPGVVGVIVLASALLRRRRA